MKFPSLKMWCPQKSCFSLYFCKNITCLHVDLLKICEVFLPVKLCFGGLRQIAVLWAICVWCCIGCSRCVVALRACRNCLVVADPMVVACCTSPCVKGFLPFNPLAFTHVPSDVTTSKLCEGLVFGNSVWLCVYKIFDFIWMRNYWLSVTFWAYFLRILNWSANKSKSLSLSNQSLEGGCWRCRPGEWGVEV